MVTSADPTRAARLENFNTLGFGLEIAPYFNPMLPKNLFNVLYTDYIPNEEIQAKAAANPTAMGCDVPQIDFVWEPGKPLQQCVPKGIKFNFSLASHVMEHVPNPVGWLNDILKTMEPGGTLRLILPDRRNTNDYSRNATSFAQLYSWWLERPAVPTPQQVADFVSEAIDDRLHSGFGPDGSPNNRVKAYSLEEAANIAEFVFNERAYIDVHCSVWTEEHFAETIQKFVRLGILNVDVVPIARLGLEFVVDLVKKGEPSRHPPARVGHPQERTANLTNAMASLVRRIKRRVIAVRR